MQLNITIPNLGTTTGAAIAILVLSGLIRSDFSDASTLGPQPDLSASMTAILTHPANTIAVMPFVDLSQQNMSYFSDGLAEDLLGRLARVDGLSVAARSASFAFKHKTLDVPQLGGLLGVAHILEGSVRTEEDRVRVAVQLIDTASGYMLWSKTYERELNGMLALQDDISQAIVKELNGLLPHSPDALALK